MLELFKFVAISGIVYLFFSALKQTYFKHMLVYIVAVTLLGAGIIWVVNVKRNIRDKTESLNKRIDSVQQSIDKFNESANKVIDTKNKIDNVGKQINNIDQSIEDKYKQYVDKLLGKKKE